MFVGIAYTTIFGIVLLNSEIDTIFLNLLKHDQLIACGFLSIGIFSPIAYPYKMFKKEVHEAVKNTTNLKQMIHILNNKHTL